MDSTISKVVDAGISSLFEGLFDKLAPPFLKSLGFLFGVGGEADKLKSAFSRIQALLNDAEDRQIKDELIRLWLRELKDAAYDAEDILDEVEYEVLRSKLEEPMQTRKRKRDQVSHLFSRFVSNLNLGPRMKEMRERLEEIESRSNHLHLKVILKSERLVPGKRPPTGSIIDESIVFGRETDREKMVGLLTSYDSSASDSGIQVVSICGMGGLGKTTLTQLIYNDERVKKHFDVSAWVYVSEDFDLIRLTKAIAESVPRSDLRPTSLDAIQVSIQNALQGKRFLLVLDDVWNDNCNDWDALRAPLMVGARGSRILVTTRSQRVSSVMGTIPTHSLQGLSDDDCWSLFKRRAFAEGNSDAHPDLVKIGKEIVKKCKGLPLAVKTLGGLLCSKVDVIEWEAILKSEMWDFPEERNDILPALLLSYHHLPTHLKRCFAYCCCIFSKGSRRVDDQIVLMWMAQGFIPSTESKHMEDIGRENLDDLCSRSLLDHNGSSVYTMHDVTHDLARFVSGTDFLEIKDGKWQKNVEKVRNVSWYLSGSTMKSFNIEDFYCLKSVRTLPMITDWNIPADLFVNLRHIRILCLNVSHVTELPESIGNLLQLRYLDLSFTSIERLPKSTTRLYHLQTLILNQCEKLEELPSDFSNLVNLRHLFLHECSVSIMPRIGRLTNLQTLGKFTVGKEIGCGINELKDIIHLGGSLLISQLENVVSVEEAKDAELKNKQKIKDLWLEWKSDDVELRQEGIEEEVLKAVQPCTTLESLKIDGYCGTTFPTWLGDPSFSKLTRVFLYRCRCHLIPPFGQLPSLKHLDLEELYGVKKVGREFYGDGTVKGFPSLKLLSFEAMHDLEEWSGLEGDITHVSYISIKNCSKLRGLPRFPLTLDRVEIEQCEKLTILACFLTIRELTLSACDEQILSSLQHLTSLSSLEIYEFPNLTSLPNGLQRLTSLQSLKIWDCPQLTSLYDAVLPTTLHRLLSSNYSNLACLPTGLQNLELLFCLKIHSLPEELPTTLQSLYIRDCPLLKEKYQEGSECWCKISHIPNITIQ